MGFIQIIEYTTTKQDDVDQLSENFRAESAGQRTVGKVTITADRDKPNTYLVIAEFPSYEEAMKNSNLPATQAFSQKMMELADGPPIFRNLDVRRVDEM